MKSCRWIATTLLLVLLLGGCAGPRYGPTPRDARPLLLREPQERSLNGGRLIFPKGEYRPVAATEGGVLYLPEGFVHAPLIERHFRAGVLVPHPGAKDTRQAVWELDDQSKVVVAPFEPPLVFESLSVD